MLTSIRLQNFKCLRDTGEVTLEPITLLIGKNDTGKTSFLSAIWFVQQMVQDQHWVRESGHEYLLRGAEGATSWALAWETGLQYTLGIVGAPGRKIHVRSERVADASPSSGFEVASDEGNISFESAAGSRQRLSAPVEYSFLRGQAQGANVAAADAARRLAAISPVFTFSHRAPDALAAMLDDMIGEDRSAFDNVEAALCAAFPNIDAIVLRRTRPVPSPKTLMFRVSGGAVVDATQVSAGVLAFTALLVEVFKVGVAPYELLLIEEPENGIHPGRLPLVAAHLKELSKRCQIILATHSPYFLDLFSPSAVHVFGRRADGEVIIRNMAELPLVQQWLSNGNSLGEMWFNVGEDRLLGLHGDETPASQ